MFKNHCMLSPDYQFTHTYRKNNSKVKDKAATNESLRGTEISHFKFFFPNKNSNTNRTFLLLEMSKSDSAVFSD